MCLWAVVRRNSLVLLLIHNKSLKKNFKISLAPDQKLWAFTAEWDGELCFEAVSVTARRGDRREATGGTRKDGASVAEASLQQRRGSASPISTWPRCFQSYVPAPTRWDSDIFLKKKQPKNHSVQRLITSLQHDELLVLRLALWYSETVTQSLWLEKPNHYLHRCFYRRFIPSSKQMT